MTSFDQNGTSMIPVLPENTPVTLTGLSETVFPDQNVTSASVTFTAVWADSFEPKPSETQEIPPEQSEHTDESTDAKAVEPEPETETETETDQKTSPSSSIEVTTPPESRRTATTAATGVTVLNQPTSEKLTHSVQSVAPAANDAIPQIPPKQTSGDEYKLKRIGVVLSEQAKTTHVDLQMAASTKIVFRPAEKAMPAKATNETISDGRAFNPSPTQMAKDAPPNTLPNALPLSTQPSAQNTAMLNSPSVNPSEALVSNPAPNGAGEPSPLQRNAPPFEITHHSVAPQNHDAITTLPSSTERAFELLLSNQKTQVSPSQTSPRSELASGLPSLPNAVQTRSIEVTHNSEIGLELEPALEREAMPSFLSSRTRDAQPHFQPPQSFAKAVVPQLLEMAPKQPGHVSELALNPEELGRVRMALSTSDNGLTLVISAERPETMDLIRRNIDDLAAEFRGLGFESLDFSFSDQAGEENSRQSRDQASSLSTGPDLASVSNDTQLFTSDSGLDLRV